MADLDEMELRMEATQLWREEIFTDRRVGTVRQMTPVTITGAVDPSRAVAFVGQTQIVTAGGMLPLNFDIPAKTLAEAVENFASAAKVALEETVRELQELRRQAASSLVIPEPGAASSILGPGGMPTRGGKPTLR